MPDRRAADSENGTRHHVCLRCGSTAVEEQFSLWVVFAFTYMWPFFPVRRSYACGECGHCWKQFRW